MGSDAPCLQPALIRRLQAMANWPAAAIGGRVSVQMTASMMTALLTKAAARLNAIRMTNS
ncbi:MAG: hypothetical protein Q27BB25_02065 [Blastomonas sp. CACIA14H2]|jgi:hypothetical protein|nr:MAG: hypothetical protein Q27BB25_02065 [Blastomonas sp. CACIA14H2]